MNNILEELKKYYANLLIIQYNGKQRASETIKLITDLMFANMALMQIRDGFDWRTAVGTQLDIIGIWVGVDKHISKEMFADHSWFSLIEISNTYYDNVEEKVKTRNLSVYQGGYSEVSNFNDVDNIGGFLTPELVTNYQTDLTVDNFRTLIGLKIIKNSISHTCKNIDDAIYNFEVKSVSGDMFINKGDITTKWDLTNRKLIYKFPSKFESLMEVAELKGVLPCPPTVSIQLELKEI